MQITVTELCNHFGLHYKGDGTLTITQASGLEGDKNGSISYVESPKYVNAALESKVEIFICPEAVELPGKTCIYTEHPDMMIVEVTNFLHPPRTYDQTIHPSVLIGKGCELAKNITLAANVVIGDDVKIGPDTIVLEGCVIGNHCRVGLGGFIHPNVTLRDNSLLGDRVVVNSGSVIGAEGFGFVTHKGCHYKIPQVGHVEIEDDVEIGASNTIDRGRFGVTRIGKGTKTDNLVHVGHNVEIGEHSLVVGMVGFAGSTKTGHHLVIGGQSMIAGHLNLGNHVTISAKSLLAKSVGDGNRYSGIPARLHYEWLKAQGLLYRLQPLFSFFKKHTEKK